LDCVESFKQREKQGKTLKTSKRAAWSNQEQPGAARSTHTFTTHMQASEQLGAARSSQEQPGAVRAAKRSQEQPGAARSSQEQPGAPSS